MVAHERPGADTQIMGETRTVAIHLRPDLKLEGRLTEPGTGSAVIAPPHPVYGGSIGNPVVRAIERRLRALGHTTLAFNFRGVGDSDGDASGDLEAALEDYLAAARVVPEPHVWMAGYSFGAVTALRAAVHLRAPNALLVAPAMALFDQAALDAYTGRLFVIAGAHDELVPAEWLKRTFGSRAQTELEMLHGLNHYFLGSAVQRLADTLERVSA